MYKKAGDMWVLRTEGVGPTASSLSTEYLFHAVQGGVSLSVGGLYRLTVSGCKHGKRKSQLLVLLTLINHFKTHVRHMHMISVFALGPEEGFASSKPDPHGEGFADF